jgi:3-hydroxyisobutyrate dehydrogenase
MSPRTVGVVGLGLMGSAIASRLMSQGYEVHGFDPVPGASATLAKAGATIHGSVSDLARNVELVLLSLPNGRVSESVCLDDDGLARSTGSTVRWIVDTTTTRPREAEQIAERLAGFPDFFDIGLSGSSHMISEGHGLALIGGGTEPPEVVTHVFESICDDVSHVGGPGFGMRTKLIINLVLGINRLAVAEAIVMGEKMGLDTVELLDVLKRSAASSKAMTIWGDRMVNRDYENPTSRVSQHTKDIGQIMELGEEYDLPMLGASQLATLARVARASGFSDLDNSVVAEVIRLMAGRGDLVVED